MAKPKHAGGRPNLGKAAKDEQVMTRMTSETKAELERIATEMDRSLSWLLNDLAQRFIAHKAKQTPATNDVEEFGGELFSK